MSKQAPLGPILMELYLIGGEVAAIISAIHKWGNLVQAPNSAALMGPGTRLKVP
jgi:hypothetical protein